MTSTIEPTQPTPATNAPYANEWRTLVSVSLGVMVACTSARQAAAQGIAPIDSQIQRGRAVQGAATV